MKTQRQCGIEGRLRLVLALVVCLGIAPLRADTLELANGDRYSGALVSVTPAKVLFQSDVQGLVSLPRAKVARVTFQAPVAADTETNAPVNAATAQAAGVFGPPTPSTLALATNGVAARTNNVVQQIRKQGIDAGLLGHVQDQILAKGTPESRQKFDELLGGLMSGKLSISDIRAQAQNSVKDIQEAKKALGGQGDDLLDGYLSILQKFVQETETETNAKTNSTR